MIIDDYNFNGVRVLVDDEFVEDIDRIETPKFIIMKRKLKDSEQDNEATNDLTKSA